MHGFCNSDSRLLLLVGHSATAATRRTGVLATSTEVPVVTETTVDAHLLHALEILTQLGLNAVREQLSVLAGGEVLLPVKEPVGDLELGRRLEDVDNALELIRVQLTSTEMLVWFFRQVCFEQGDGDEDANVTLDEETNSRQLGADFVAFRRQSLPVSVSSAIFKVMPVSYGQTHETSQSKTAAPPCSLQGF